MTVWSNRSAASPRRQPGLRWGGGGGRGLWREGGMGRPRAEVDVYVVPRGELASRLASRLAEQLRDGRLRVLLHCGGGSFKSQMKKADASGARVAVVIGDDE